MRFWIRSGASRKTGRDFIFMKIILPSEPEIQISNDSKAVYIVQFNSVIEIRTMDRLDALVKALRDMSLAASFEQINETK